MATYRSEFVAAHITTEQIIALHSTLWYLGVPIKWKAYMFIDDQLDITSSTIPHSRLTKRHNALSYHHVREAIATKILAFVYKKGEDNPADILSKHCGYPQLWPHVQPLLFCRGDPSGTNDDQEKVVKGERIEI